MSKSKNGDNDEDLQSSLIRLAQPGLSSKDLLKEIKKLHPRASKKDIIKAAFSSLIDVAGTDGDKAVRLQDLAMAERQSGVTE